MGNNLLQLGGLSALKLGDVVVIRVEDNPIAATMSVAVINSSLMARIYSAHEWYVIGEIPVEHRTTCRLDRTVGGFEFVVGKNDNPHLFGIKLSEAEATTLLRFLIDPQVNATPPPRDLFAPSNS